MTSRGEWGIWQRRYWEHTIRDDRDFAAHMDYTHFNPVKHGLVEHPADWRRSSFRRCVDGGLYPDGWRVTSDEPQERTALRFKRYGAAGGPKDPTTMVEAECAALFRPTLANPVLRGAAGFGSAPSRRRRLLGGRCNGLMCDCCRSICLEEGADVAHRQMDLVRGVLPWVEAHLRVGCQMR